MPELESSSLHGEGMAPSHSSEAVRARKQRALVDALWMVLSASVFAILIGFIFRDPIRIGWDAALYLQSGGEILRGRLPFVDIVDVNPPLVQFLNVAPALIAGLTGLQAPLVFNLWVASWSGLSIWASFWLLSKPAFNLSTERMLRIVFALAFINLLAWVNGHFGQREHFIVLALVPLLLLRWLRYEQQGIPRLAALSIGIFGGVALAIKPQYLLPLALFEVAAWAIRPGRATVKVGAELIGIVTTLVVYVGLFIAYPAMSVEYWGHYLWLFVRGYRVYDCTMWALCSPTPFMLVVVGIALAANHMWGAKAPAFARPTMYFLVGSVAAYLLQYKGWPYQLYPALSLMIVELAIVLPLPKYVAMAFAALAMIFTIRAQLEAPIGRLPEEFQTEPLRRAVETLARPDDSVLVLSTSVLGPYPMLLQLGLHPGSRFLWLPELPMFYPHSASEPCKYRRSGEGTSGEQQLLDSLNRDIAVRVPHVIAVESEPSKVLQQGCTVSGWLRESGLFQQAMTDYESMPGVPGFEIWRRRSGK